MNRMNEAKAQAALAEINARFHNKQIHFTDVYASVDELIADLKAIRIPSRNEMVFVPRFYTGYQYVHSFAQRVQCGKELTEKQLVQAKRLAIQIKKAATISPFWD